MAPLGTKMSRIVTFHFAAQLTDAHNATCFSLRANGAHKEAKRGGSSLASTDGQRIRPLLARRRLMRHTPASLQLMYRCLWLEKKSRVCRLECDQLFFTVLRVRTKLLLLASRSNKLTLRFSFFKKSMLYTHKYIRSTPIYHCMVGWLLPHWKAESNNAACSISQCPLLSHSTHQWSQLRLAARRLGDKEATIFFIKNINVKDNLKNSRKKITGPRHQLEQCGDDPICNSLNLCLENSA